MSVETSLSLTSSEHFWGQHADTWLACPDCKQVGLSYSAQVVNCPACSRCWDVLQGIPRFTQDQHLASFGYQWQRYDVAHGEEDRRTFVAKTGIPLSEWKGLTVLDAGCGGGRYARIAALAGATVVAVDHTAAVNRALALCADLPNVGFLQADLKRLPLKPESFDVVFSIGVMHHDRDTREVFEAVAPYVKPGGKYVVWLYRKNRGWQEKLNLWLRERTTRMSPSQLERWCRLGACLGGIPVLNRLLNKIVNFSSHPCWNNRVCDTFDWYAPQYQHHHTVAEVLHWFEIAGFVDLQVLPPEKQGWLYRWFYEHDMIIGSGVNVLGLRPPRKAPT
ncbi:MAG: hypothetical protein KatS3mg113_0830 [Planctomycetaceae bacterium]|nr:MAG: hypothetical protein KatS3mg113_0830 [Planctomycetaceae bacterium]